jgi:hypothetical protein
MILPTYAFQREQYWVDGLGAGSKSSLTAGHLETSLNMAIGPPINKMLGRVIKTPFASETIFLTQFSCDTLPVIADHMINSFLIVPAVFDVGCVLEAHNYILGPGSRVLEGVMIPAALVLNDIATRPIQLIVSGNSEKEMDWQLVSLKTDMDPDDPDSWLGNASGTMSLDLTATSRMHVSAEDMKARLKVKCEY